MHRPKAVKRIRPRPWRSWYYANKTNRSTRQITQSPVLRVIFFSEIFVWHVSRSLFIAQWTCLKAPAKELTETTAMHSSLRTVDELCYYAAALIGHIAAFARPSVCPSVCPMQPFNSKTKDVKNKVGVDFLGVLR